MERRFQEKETDETAEWMLVRWSGHCRGPHWGVGVGESRGAGLVSRGAQLWGTESLEARGGSGEVEPAGGQKRVG